VFLGTHAPRLDEKGRLFLPAKFRDELAEGLVITKGQERCLYVFPTVEFGRITIPPALREYAGLTRDCAVIGANTRVEIWDSAAWESYLAAQEPAFSELGEEVLPGVL
jgi:MraZ protein